jgi:hypothetical protein
MARTPTKATEHKVANTPGLTPVDRLIMAMAALVEDRTAAPNIRHLFVSQANGNLQISLDMHAPVER